mmetsp:Transcript_114081/g.363716  ORF Transcript_114081/g.363716 Transcript_114081/m.363716 type:complete len:244 (+) Transcript_114081:965-1696(+)
MRIDGNLLCLLDPVAGLQEDGKPQSRRQGLGVLAAQAGLLTSEEGAEHCNSLVQPTLRLEEARVVVHAGEGVGVVGAQPGLTTLDIAARQGFCLLHVSPRVQQDRQVVHGAEGVGVRGAEDAAVAVERLAVEALSLGAPPLSIDQVRQVAQAVQGVRVLGAQVGLPRLQDAAEAPLQARGDVAQGLHLLRLVIDEDDPHVTVPEPGARRADVVGYRLRHQHRKTVKPKCRTHGQVLRGSAAEV